MDGCGLIRPDGSLCGFTAVEVLDVKQQRDSLSKFFWWRSQSFHPRQLPLLTFPRFLERGKLLIVRLSGSGG